MLRLDNLPAETQRVFSYLASNTLLKRFTLIGGTALSLQIGHRSSEDLDFWVPASCMPTNDVNGIVSMARDAGLDIQLVTPNEKIINAKINHGINLLDYARDYAINGVKVTFFSRHDPLYRHFDTFPRLHGTDTAFQIMGQEGIFAMKSHVIYQRVRSRDIFDLKTFIQNGKSIPDIFAAALASDCNCTQEYAKSVLTGEIPLDKDDEGMSGIGITETIENLYDFFRNAIDNHERLIQREAPGLARISLSALTDRHAYKRAQSPARPALTPEQQAALRDRLGEQARSVGARQQPDPDADLEL